MKSNDKWKNERDVRFSLLPFGGKQPVRASIFKTLSWNVLNMVHGKDWPVLHQKLLIINQSPVLKARNPRDIHNYNYSNGQQRGFNEI